MTVLICVVVTMLLIVEIAVLVERRKEKRIEQEQFWKEVHQRHENTRAKILSAGYLLIEYIKSNPPHERFSPQWNLGLSRFLEQNSFRIRLGIYPPPSSETVQKLADRYCEYLETNSGDSL